jgi:hypothetical protein
MTAATTSTATTTTGLLGQSTLSPTKRVIIYVPVVVFSLLAIWVIERRPYTAGSDFGYYLGLVGSLMMASLLLYPLRKHVKMFQNFGSLRAWFVVHMVFGIAGPILVLFHSTFQTRSFNATVAFWAMVVVLVSGVVGRFVFTRMYKGLEGNKATLREMQTFLAKCTEDSRRALDLVPDVEKALNDYRAQAAATNILTWRNFLMFFAIEWKGKRLIARARKQVIPALQAEAQREGWPKSWYEVEKKIFYGLIEDYVTAIDMTSRYDAWEKLLGWWQLAHVPLVYVLLITALIHVYAVHMY